MSRRAQPTPALAAASVLAALTSFFTLLSWDGLADHASFFLVPLFWVCAGTAALGLGLRYVGIPRLLVPLLQLLALGVVLLHMWAPDAPLGGWVPTPSAFASAGEVLRSALEQSSQYAAPVPERATDFPALLLGAGSLLVVAVDLLACTLRRPPLAGLPLLVAFTVPVALLGGVSWLIFALAALGFVLLLTADHADRLSGWGTEGGEHPSRVDDNQPHEVHLSSLWPGATRVGLAGVGLAVLAPTLLPAGQNFLQRSDGLGSGDGEGGMGLTNPFVDMKRDLTRGDDVDLVRVRTEDPSPAYLRLVVLDQFDGTAWRPGPRSIPPGNQARGRLPAAPGLSTGTPRTEQRTTVTVAPTFETQWLPSPYPASELRVDGDWRFDRDTLDLLSADDDLTGAGLSYEVTALDLTPGAAQLVSAGPAPRSLYDANTTLPSTTPPWLEELAVEVTDGARSTFERAVQLQSWFRRTGGFEYTLDHATGNGLQSLQVFLGTGPDSRRGYCEQFASAMAMMARSVGIPARVAVGFLRPDAQPDGSWVYSAHDAHAWPELYFEGAGWVRFEPTPSARTADPPGYTSGTVPAPPSLDDVTASPSVDEVIRPDQTQRDQATSEVTSSGGGTSWWLAAVAAPLLLVALGAAPRLLRAFVRRRRYAAVAPPALAEGCWAEVRDTAVDLGRSWDEGATLRRRARDLVPALVPAQGAPRDAAAEDQLSPVAALERLVLLVERSRYSRTGLTAADTGTLRTMTGTVTEALAASARPSRRRQATWLPRSLWATGRAAIGRRTGRGTAKVAQGAPLEQMSV